MLKLQALEGNAAGSDIAVEEELVIGRTASEEGRLGDDPEISRQHARVTRSGEGYVIEDLGSMNGTFVNGDRLQAPHQLGNGDYIEVGATRLQVQLEQPEAPPAPDVEISPQDELGATRIASVPDIPAPPAEPAPAEEPAPAAQGGDTFVKPPEEPAPAGDTFVPPPDEPAPAAGPQAPAEPPTEMPPPTGPPQDTVTPAPVPSPPEPTDLPPPTGPPQDTVTPAPVPAEPEPADLPPPTGPPQDTVTPAPVPPAEPEPRQAAPLVSLNVQIDTEAGEATIELAEGADRVRLVQEEGRWVLKPDVG